MSKPVKQLISKQYEALFEGYDGVVVLDMCGLDANANNALRTTLAEKGIKVTIVKNSLARKVVQGTSLEPIAEVLEGPCAFVFGGESVVNVARELMPKVKELQHIDFKGAVLDGQLFQAAEVERLSKFPTRDEAIADVLGCILGAGGNLLGAIVGPGSTLGGQIAQIEEKLEKGEEIKQAG